VTRKRIRDINETLKRHGRKMCPACEEVHDLTDAHWYVSERKNADGTTGTQYSTYCRPCTRFMQSERDTDRYYHDADYRARKREANRDWMRENREANAAAAARYRARKMARRLSALLGEEVS